MDTAVERAMRAILTIFFVRIAYATGSAISIIVFVFVGRAMLVIVNNAFLEAQIAGYTSSTRSQTNKSFRKWKSRRKTSLADCFTWIRWWRWWRLSRRHFNDRFKSSVAQHAWRES